jgi:hypothetical protein
MLRASDADLMAAGLEAEAPGQSAAAGLQLLETGTSLLEHVRVGIPAHDRVLVAMHLRQHPPGQWLAAASPECAGSGVRRG